MPLLATPVLAASNSGNFLVSPGLGVMVWTLIAFVIAMYLLSKLAFPRIASELDKRQRAIEESIESAERTKRESQQLLDEYRERLREARQQADDIVARARQAAESVEREQREAARAEHEQRLEQTRREIEQQTQRAIADLRREVAELTIAATEKVARKALDSEDQRRLVEDAVRELDFTALSGTGR